MSQAKRMRHDTEMPDVICSTKQRSQNKMMSWLHQIARDVVELITSILCNL
jgi:hypothetical protein